MQLMYQRSLISSSEKLTITALKKLRNMVTEHRVFKRPWIQTSSGTFNMIIYPHLLLFQANQNYAGPKVCVKGKD